MREIGLEGFFGGWQGFSPAALGEQHAPAGTHLPRAQAAPSLPFVPVKKKTHFFHVESGKTSIFFLFWIAFFLPNAGFGAAGGAAAR